MVGAFGVERLEAVDHVLREILAGREAPILVEAVVIGLERVRDHEMAHASDRHPIGQFVVEAVAVVQEAAELEMEAARVGARPACHPAGWTHAGDALDGLDAEPDMSRSISSGITV